MAKLFCNCRCVPTLMRCLPSIDEGGDVQKENKVTLAVNFERLSAQVEKSARNQRVHLVRYSELP
ncbi:hypothetical protein RR48_07364 [Papilio machaon]|uniref:Uncharacterized protein n=1 Tax=Papilio machaon TaxID=76193 RepID=A0A194RK99_PAPMA|nr:hypothetical protein RR48_07364 [Papilio machaon]